MLHDFLITERTGILALCRQKLAVLADSRTTSTELDNGLPVFYDELIDVLREDEKRSASHCNTEVNPEIHREAAKRRGKESLRLGYSISQVVHGYGALCQAITEYAVKKGGEPIHAREFNRLNLCLDVAIAEAVTEFHKIERENLGKEELKRLGFLSHELRNSLNVAIMAHRMIKSGQVGIAGNTNQVLEESLDRMREIIHRSLSEVRLQSEPAVDFQRCRVHNLTSEVQTTALYAASDKSIKLAMEVSPELEVLADPHLISSALSNLVQNAIKFTKPGRTVWIRSYSKNGRVIIEVEDQCGGLGEGKIESLFEPYSQNNPDKSGIGLGLTIARRAIELCNGVLSARSIPNRGCIFKIELPQHISATQSAY
jgi:signal transduction histidine kinase